MSIARPISSAVVKAPPRAVPLTERLGHMSDVTLMACELGANRLSTALLAVLMMTGSDMYAESLYRAVYDTACCSHYKQRKISNHAFITCMRITFAKISLEQR